MCNALGGRRSEVDVWVDWPTFDNLFLGRGNVVEDYGALDCDGDGTADPNGISGAIFADSGIHVAERVQLTMREGPVH